MPTKNNEELNRTNYLVPHLLAFKVKEYTPKGEVVSEIKTDLPELGGRATEAWPFTEIRLENGNTLVDLTHSNQVAWYANHGRLDNRRDSNCA